MKKGPLILCLVFAALLVGGCVFGYFRLFRNVEPEPIKDATYKVVPLDAVLVQHFSSLATVTESLADTSGYFSHILHQGGGLRTFLTQYVGFALDKHPKLSQVEALFSLHDAEKNTLRILLGLSLDGIEMSSDIWWKEFVANYRIPVTVRTYDGVQEYCLYEATQPFYVAFVKNYLIGSVSSVVLESSIRHLKTNGSLLDNPYFARVVEETTVNKSTRLFLSHDRIPKIFAMYFGPRLQKYASFCKTSATWTALDGTIDVHWLLLDGYSIMTQGFENYLTTFIGQTPQKQMAFSMLPANTVAFISLGLTDLPTFFTKQASYLDQHKKRVGYVGKPSLPQWFQLLYPTEITLACVPFQGKIEWISIVHSQYIQQAKIQYALLHKQTEGAVMPHPETHLLEKLFGSLFSLCDDSFYCYQGSYILYGPEALLTEMKQRSATDSYHSLARNLKLTPFSDRVMENANVTLFLQPTVCLDSLAILADARYRNAVQSLAAFNAQYVVCQFNALDTRMYTHLAIYGDSLAHSPLIPLPKVERRKSGGVVQDSLQTAHPPYTVINHATQKNNLLDQMPWPDCHIILYDHNKKKSWDKPLEGPIQDTVVQIDFLKNNKLQMLFAVGSRLYLLDRLGRPVSPYPKTYSQSITYGPYVFDYLNNKEYQVFLFHQDGVLRRYTKSGEPQSGWTDYLLPDYPVAPLTLLVFDKTPYWVVYTNSQTVFLTNSGETAVALSQHQCIDPSQEPVVVAPHIIKVITLAGKILLVNLATGEIKNE